MDAKSRATALRDMLNNMTVIPGDGNDVESVVMRCALAAAVELLEEYLYRDGLTPSVVPATEVSGWKPTFESLSRPPAAPVETSTASAPRQLSSLATSAYNVLCNDSTYREKVLAAGGRIRGIKLLRTDYGQLGLKGAIDLYDRVVREVAAGLIKPYPVTAAAIVATMDSQLVARMKALIRDGREPDAIKLCQASDVRLSDLDLAKEIVDYIWKTLEN